MAYNDSEVATQAFSFHGVTLHDPVDPEGTIRHYLYWGGDRNEDIEVPAENLMFVGREYPVTDFGDTARGSVSVTLVIPSGDDHNESVQDLRNRVLSKTTLCYRDNRGRVVFGTVSGLSLTDTQTGTEASFTIERVSYSEVV